MHHAIFALELCLPLRPGDSLQSELKELIVRQPAMSRPGQKHQFYSRVASLLKQRLGDAVSGCWDFFDDDARARRDHEMWFNGMATREGSRKSPSGPGDAYRGDLRYLTFTLSLLLDGSGHSVRRMAATCDIPEGALWTRPTFARVLGGVPQLSFASVRSDVVYLIPRDDGWGLTAQDLADPKFHYLRPLGEGARSTASL